MVRVLLFCISLFLGSSIVRAQSPIQKNYIGVNLTGLIHKTIQAQYPQTFELTYLRNIKSRAAFRISAGYEHNNRHRRLDNYRQQGLNVKAQINLYDPSRRTYLFTGFILGRHQNAFSVKFQGDRFGDLIVPIDGSSNFHGYIIGSGFHLDLGKNWLLETLIYMTVAFIDDPNDLVKYYHLAGAGQKYQGGFSESGTFLRAQINLLIPL